MLLCTGIVIGYAIAEYKNDPNGFGETAGQIIDVVVDRITGAEPTPPQTPAYG